MANLEYVVVRKKKIDKELYLRVLFNEAAERILIEFSSKNGKMLLQKSFQNNITGKEAAKVFEKSYKSIKQLKKHFGFK